MFELLYEVANIPNALIDMEGKILAGAGWQSICTDFHRKHPDSETLCIESDTHIKDEIAAGQSHCIYECPLGLVDSSCPVIINGEHLGNVFTGQMLHSPLTDESRARFRDQAKQYGYDENAYLAALERVPVFPIEKHEEILKLLANIAVQLANSGLARLNSIEHELKIQASEQYFRAITNQSSEGISVTDMDGNYTFVNAAFCSMVGYTESELLTMSVFDLRAKSGTEGTFDRTITADEGVPVTVTLVRKDGAEFIAEVTAKVLDINGQKSALGTVRDISKDKADELLLRASEEKLHTIIQTSIEGYWLVDLEGRFLDVNNAYIKMSGYQKSELLKMRISDIDVNETPEDTANRIKALVQKRSGRFESIHQRKDNSQYHVDVSVQFQAFDGGRFVCFIRDISERKEAEALLKKSEHYSRLILDTIAEGVALNEIIFNDKGDMVNYRILEVNQAFYKVANFNKDIEVIGGLATELYGMDPDVIKYFYINHKSITKPVHTELAFGDKVFSIETSPFENNLFITTFQDITETRRDEQALKQNLFLLGESQRIAHLGSYMLDVEKGEWESSPALDDLFGIEVGYPRDVYGWLSLMHPEDKDMMQAYLQKDVFTEHQPFDKQYRIQRANDSEMRWVHGMGKLEFSDTGELIKMTGVIQDITDRKLAEEEMVKSQALLQSIFDGIPEAIVATNTNREIVSINRGFRNIFGYDDSDILGKPTACFYESEAEFQRLGKERYNLTAEEQLKAYVVNYRKANGDLFPGETMGLPIKDSRGEKIGFLGVIRDISEKLRLESQLRQSQKLEALGTMVSGISHEFNNVLQSMFLYAGLVQSALPQDEELQSNFQHVVDYGYRAKDLIKQILTFSRKTKIEMKPQALHEIVSDALALERASMPVNIDIQQNIDTNCGMVLCDKTQIHQIIINLCNNAQQAMEEHGGTLSVGLRQIPDSINSGAGESEVLELTVSDTGRGVDPSDLEKIFDPFFTTKQIGRGTGLGLSVIHGIIDMMEGQISVESELGAGTTFRILLPVADKIIEDTPQPNFDRNSVFHSVLLVDDEESIRIATQLVLEQEGFTVDSASDGQEALNLFNANPGKYDLIVTDQSMPRVSGLELTQEIRKSNATLSILLSTGHLGSQDTQEFKDAGITGFIQKPWTAKEMIATIQDLDENT